MSSGAIAQAFIVFVMLIHCIGAILGWKFIVDPPKNIWYMYHQSFFRLFLEPPQLRAFTIGYSLLVIAVALIA